MTNLELASIKEAIDFWWRHEDSPSYDLPIFIATLMGYVQRMDGAAFNLEDGTWKYPSGVQA